MASLKFVIDVERTRALELVAARLDFVLAAAGGARAEFDVDSSLGAAFWLLWLLCVWFWFWFWCESGFGLRLRLRLFARLALAY